MIRPRTYQRVKKTTSCPLFLLLDFGLRGSAPIGSFRKESEFRLYREPGCFSYTGTFVAVTNLFK